MVRPPHALWPQEGLPIALHQAGISLFLHIQKIFPPQQCSAVIASPDWEAGYRPISSLGSFSTISLLKEFIINKVCNQIKVTEESKFLLCLDLRSAISLNRVCLGSMIMLDVKHSIQESFSVTGKNHLWMVLFQIHLIILVLEINKVYPQHLY